MTRKQYSVAFKQQAVQLALSGEKSKTQTARDLGVPPSKLYAWIHQYGPDAPPAVFRIGGGNDNNIHDFPLAFRCMLYCTRE